MIVTLGATLLAVTAWQWAGRTARARRWVHRVWGRESTLAVQPGAGLMFLSGGLLSIVGAGRAPWLGIPVFCGMLLAGLGMLFLVPRWWGPGWYRKMPASKRDRPDTSDPLTALAVAATSGTRVSSAKQARQAFGRSRPVTTWRAGWVYDPDTAVRPHGLARAGTVEGVLVLYPAGLLFAGSRREDAIRDTATVLVIPVDEVTGARVVPARAGADGVPRAGWLYRSWFRRLVVDTASDSYVFEIGYGRAVTAAARITNHLEEPR